MRESTDESSPFKNEETKAAFMAAYDRVMAERWPVPFETRDVATRFGTTHVVTSGPPEGPPVVLLHGGGSSSAMWFSIVGQLAESGHRCVALDRVGDVGRSTIKELPRNEETLADWLLECLDGLEVDKPPMIGLSYGGFMNINFARHHPDRIASIIMLSPGGVFARLRRRWTLRMVVSIGSGYEPLVRNAFSYISGGRTPDELTFELARLGWATWKGPELLPPVYTDDELGSVAHPSLLLVGDRDVIYDPVKVCRRAEATMPDVEVALIPGGGHTLSLDVPEAVGRRILDFLADRASETD